MQIMKANKELNLLVKFFLPISLGPFLLSKLILLVEVMFPEKTSPV